MNKNELKFQIRKTINEYFDRGKVTTDGGFYGAQAGGSDSGSLSAGLYTDAHVHRTITNQFGQTVLPWAEQNAYRAAERNATIQNWLAYSGPSAPVSGAPQASSMVPPTSPVPDGYLPNGNPYWIDEDGSAVDQNGDVIVPDWPKPPPTHEEIMRELGRELERIRQQNRAPYPPWRPIVPASSSQG